MPYWPLLAGFRPVNLAFELEHHFSCQDGHQFIGVVDEVLSTLAERVGPRVATKAAIDPGSGDLFPVQAILGRHAADLAMAGASQKHLNEALDLPPASIPVGRFALLVLEPLVDDRRVGWQTNTVQVNDIAIDDELDKGGFDPSLSRTLKA